MSGNGQAAGDPYNLWTGLATGPVAATLRDKTNYVNMSGWAKIRWVTRSNGFNALRPIVKLADGNWYIGDRAESNTNDYVETEFTLSDLRWLKLDIDRVSTTGSGAFFDQWQRPDLTKVDEIGFADLIAGGGHGAGAWVNLGKFEVYGFPVKR